MAKASWMRGDGEALSKGFLDFLGHIAYFLIFVGVFLLTREMQAGWVFRFLGDVGWVLIGFKLRMSSIVLWGSGFAILDVLGYLNWGG
jgi:hypothetical protein